MNKKLRVKVTTYKNYLIIETVKPEEDKNFVPVGGNRFGCVLIDTEFLLGISKEAIKEMKRVDRGYDALGDITMWTTTDGKDCFGWIGGLKRMVDVQRATYDRDGFSNIKHVTIKNEPPLDAIDEIDVAITAAKEGAKD